MRRILITSLLTLVVVFAGCSDTDTEDLQGKFSTKKPQELIISQGTYVGTTNTLTYGTEVPIASFFLTSNTRNTISVASASFLVKRTGLYEPTDLDLDDLSYKIYPVIGGVIDTSQEVSIAAFGSSVDPEDIRLSLSDPTLGSTYALQVSTQQEYVLVAEVIDDGELNTNELYVETVADWEWSKKPDVLTTSDAFPERSISGGSVTTSK